ncbi:SIS domain-containing protein [Motilibacter aurantiacus]|uniref:SIS domain-containing protein n=1 Tax=Motilibacter aurantiacus TaxID=2714955 RepID=UPI001408C69F|nr:sugar isomerase [Motilibacter aurantiacus]NHC44500.1 sugar isomerase [Motilibacter aurantiacus]
MATFVETEIAAQPECWRRAAGLAPAYAEALPQPGERVAVVGCGTSWFMAMSYAALREQAGQGWTDAFAGSEFPTGREYDRLVAITRSGTTSEIVSLLQQTAIPATVITACPGEPAAAQAGGVVDLSFADEESVVQTRFATTTLALLRASLGESIDAAAADAEAALTVEVSGWVPATQVSFLGRGWTVGLAHEAALKAREASQSWCEAYPAMDYRHGPIAVAEAGRLVWMFGEPPAGLTDDVERTGAELVTSELDPLAHLVVAQRLAVAKAQALGLDPDRPRSLTRAVVLSPGQV